MKLTNSQQIAYDALMRGENIFLTGGAGTGKTTLIKQFINEVDPNCEETLLAAPTGKAALNLSIDTDNGCVQGSTVHRLFGLKAGPIPEFKGNVPKIISQASRIIIDEISMMRIDVFDYVADVIMEETNNSFIRRITNKPLQIILVGDFFQLPPVLPTTAAEGVSDKQALNAKYEMDVGKGYCFQSYAWELLEIKKYELTEIMRQKDDEEFCKSLNMIRIGDPSGINYINNNCDQSRFQPDRITLCGTNRNADVINNAMLGRNPNKKVCYQWEIKTKLPPDRITGYLKNVQCVEKLILCVGAKVICIANCKSAMNGTIGEITSIADDHVIVKWENGEENRVDPYEWEITRQTIKEDSGKTKIISSPVLSISQLPLKIGYAITVHKAQGETFKEANIMTDTFETGHLYTALSRCSNVHKMRLYRPLRKDDVKCDQTINNFYKGV